MLGQVGSGEVRLGKVRSVKVGSRSSYGHVMVRFDTNLCYLSAEDEGSRLICNGDSLTVQGATSDITVILHHLLPQSEVTVVPNDGVQMTTWSFFITCNGILSLLL